MACTGLVKLSLLLLVVVFASFIPYTEANWFGKRGAKVDDTLLQILEGGMPPMLHRPQEVEAVEALRAIGKIVHEYFQRSMVDKTGDK